MRWGDSRSGGFTDGDPWLPMGPYIEKRNVAVQQEDERSLLWLYKKLLSLRRQEPALVTGSYVPLRSHNDILSFKRVDGGVTFLIALNLKHEPRRLGWDVKGRLMLSTYLD